jgi:SAM-dependent methyltransferase
MIALSLTFWDGYSQKWAHFGSPLRPTAQDVELFERLVADHRGSARSPAVRAVLLGVTPEIAMMRWPSNTKLLAIDHNMAMIRNVWPGDKIPGGKAVCAGWATMPVADRACEVVIGDGCFCLLPSYPDDYSAVFREIRRVLKPDGTLVARVYIRPPVAERVEDVFEDLRQRRIGSFHVFKQRLKMAVQGDITRDVRRSEVWNAWHKAIPDPAILVSELNWSLDAISTMESFHDSNAYFTFPTLKELREAVSSYFVETDCFLPDYELGDRSPIINLRVRGGR